MDLWRVEEIPDGDSLFYRVSVNWLGADKKPHPGIFRENKGSISADWEKYSTAKETRARQGRPERFAVLPINVGGIREIAGLEVKHSPTQNVAGLPDNQAHTDVFGLEHPLAESTDLGRKLRLRTELYRRFNKWKIPPDAPID